MLKNSKAFKFLIGTFAIAALAFAMTASAADFGTTTLKVGSTGEFVKTLQTLVGASPVDGSFGPMTKAAVMAWQANNGLTADGLFGNMSKAKANATSTTSTTSTSTTTTTTGTTTVSLCPNGMTLASNCATAPAVTTTTGTLCPNGYLLSNNCAAVIGAVVTSNGTDGSITATQSSLVSSAPTVNTGSRADIVAVRLQAIQGPVKVNRVDVHFNVRPWLYFSNVTLHDGAGTGIAAIPTTDSTTSTEITVGSDYLVSFSGLSYTVTPGANTDLAVSVTVLSGTNKISTSTPVFAAIEAIKTTNPSGWADSVSGFQTTPNGGWYLGSNTVNLSSNGGVASIYANISALSPTTAQVSVSQSSGTTTPSVTLGVFSLKSTNTSSTISALNVGVVSTLAVNGGSTGNAGATAALSNIKLFGPGCANGCGGSFGTSTSFGGAQGTITFSNLTTPLTQDAWTDFTVKADVAGLTTGNVYLVLAGTSSGSIVGTDTNYNTPLLATGSSVLTNTLTMTSSAVALSNMSYLTTGSALTGIVDSTSSASVSIGYGTNLSFTLTNNGNNTLYVPSTNVAAFLASTFTAAGAGTAMGTTTLGVSISSPAMNGDGTGYLAVPIGQARTFTINGGGIYANGNLATNSIVHGGNSNSITGISYYDTAAHAAVATASAVSYPSPSSGSLGSTAIVSNIIPVILTVNL